MKKVNSLIKGKSLYFVRSGESVLDVVKFMAEKNIGAVPVLDGDKLVGIFSERDLMKRVVAKGLDPAKVRVDDVMTREILIARSDETYKECMVKMQKAGVRHLPIVDQNNKLIGMLSLRDLLAFDLNEKTESIEMLHAYIYYHPPIE
jgi:CBS domain-containing protein